MGDEEEYQVPSFSAEDWVRGRVDYLPVLPVKGQEVFQYGVYRTVNGLCLSFVVRKGKNLPESVISMREIEGGTGTEARRLADEMVAATAKVSLAQAPAPEAPVITVGSVVVHNDPQGSHSALILRIDGDQAQALFLTSKLWGVGREASLDECRLLGLTPWKTTYLVLVTRPLLEFYAYKGQFPFHRLQEYLEEFSPYMMACKTVA